jgi:plastocyanin
MVALAAVWAIQPAAAESQTVSMENSQYVPASVTIDAGDSVTWVHNDGSVPHTITSTADDGATFDQTVMNSSAPPFTFTFNEAGTYDYLCRFHPNMVGTVTVLAQQATPEPTTEPTTEPGGQPTEQPAGQPTTQPTTQPAGAPSAPGTGTGLATGHESGTPWALWLASALALAAVAGGTTLVARKATSRR